MNNKNGGRAFPVPDDASSCPGMTLRDWFAGQALSGIIQRREGYEWIAAEAYLVAEAMLEERKK